MQKLANGLANHLDKLKMSQRIRRRQSEAPLFKVPHLGFNVTSHTQDADALVSPAFALCSCKKSSLYGGSAQTFLCVRDPDSLEEIRAFQEDWTRLVLFSPRLRAALGV